jgi:hypothetical protein
MKVKINIEYNIELDDKTSDKVLDDIVFALSFCGREITDYPDDLNLDCEESYEILRKIGKDLEENSDNFSAIATIDS